MKKLLIGILTIFITVNLILLGLSINLKGTIVDTVGIIVKENVVENIADYLEENTSVSKDDAKKSINEILESNNTIKKTVNGYFDKIMDIMNDKEVTDINIASDIEILINENESTLKKYGINITEEDKKGITSVVSNEEINKKLNESITEFKNSMPSESKIAIDIFNFVRGTTFKIILVSVIVAFLALIALLKKSPYKWLVNLGTASILSGLSVGVLVPSILKFITESLSNEATITISTTHISNYGYIVLIIGIISIILHTVISIITKKKVLVAE